MTQNTHLDFVTEFYDTHPISEGQVLDKLVQDGFDLSSLDQGILKDYDQDHFGGSSTTWLTVIPVRFEMAIRVRLMSG